MFSYVFEETGVMFLWPRPSKKPKHTQGMYAAEGRRKLLSALYLHMYEPPHMIGIMHNSAMLTQGR